MGDSNTSDLAQVIRDIRANRYNPDRYITDENAARLFDIFLNDFDLYVARRIYANFAHIPEVGDFDRVVDIELVKYFADTLQHNTVQFLLNLDHNIPIAELIEYHKRVNDELMSKIFQLHIHKLLSQSQIPKYFWPTEYLQAMSK